MSAEGGTKSIIAAMSANIGIAIVKFVAALLSASASMLAEAIHSLADSVNQILLLVGRGRARKSADLEHPFGYGRARYVFAFIVAIVMFSVGGVFSLYEGVEKVQEPHPLDPTWWWLPLVVLVISIGLESFSLSTAVREARPAKGEDSWVGYVRHAKSPEVPVVMLEDLAALVGLVLALLGVGITAITGDGLWDGIGTLCIGVLLVAVALILGLEMGSLLIGEGANLDDLSAIAAAIETHPAVERVIHLKTLYVGPDELMVGAKLAFPAGRAMDDVARDIDSVEGAVRAAVPAARIIYIEPDVYRPGADPAPLTSCVIAPPSTSPVRKPVFARIWTMNVPTIVAIPSRWMATKIQNATDMALPFGGADQFSDLTTTASVSGAGSAPGWYTSGSM